MSSQGGDSSLIARPVLANEPIFTKPERTWDQAWISMEFKVKSHHIRVIIYPVLVRQNLLPF